MQDIDTLIKRVVKYLRINGVLEGRPVFESTVSDFVCVDPKGYWDEYYMQAPYWQTVRREFHASEFQDIDSQFERANLWTVQDRAMEDIPNSGNVVIVELGSEYGANGAGYLAAHKSNVKVILVSKAWDEEKPPEYLFMEPAGPIPRLVFKRGKGLLTEPDLEKRVNGLYKENGICNVIFYQHTLTLSEAEGELPPFLQNLSGKDIYLIGRQSPTTLPSLIGKLYHTLNARYLSVSLTAQEKTKPDAFTWGIIQRNLGLSSEELRDFIKSAHDPEAAKTKYSLSYKYDYSKPAERRIGVMIKLAIAMALAKEVNGRVLRDDGTHYVDYNKTDHYVEARR